MGYLVFDIETSYGEYNGRVGSPWSSDCKLCATGWVNGDGEYNSLYYPGGSKDYGMFCNLDGIDVLIGHNIKFDLLWYWNQKELQDFIARGGRVWDTMYAEYLLSAQFYNSKMKGSLSLKGCAERRNLQHNKLDMVAALWDSGVATEDIDEKILMEYLKADVLTTEELYKAQILQAAEQNQITMIVQRMEGLLATTEMESNGLTVDRDVAERQMAILVDQIKDRRLKLDTHVPSLPEGCTFNWASWRNVSALLFGGHLKYKAQRPVYDDSGNLQYYKTKVDKPILDEGGNPVFFKSGKNAGMPKTKKHTVDDIARGPKTKQTDLSFGLPRLVQPKDQWASSVEGYWSTGADILEELKAEGLELVQDLLELKQYEKDLGTYYLREHKGRTTGMLTNIQELDQRVHGHLNHTVTATTRLSSSKPNLQNVSGKGKSEIKKVFVSRFDRGVMAEVDYSQLEVVTKGVLSGDTNLLDALTHGIDFHCEWLAFAEGLPYEEVVHNCKTLGLPEWKKKRQAIKSVTFGEAYGAGVKTLCESSGLDADTIKKAMDARKLRYPDMYAFDDFVVASIEKSRKSTHLRTEQQFQRGVGFYRSVTDTIYSFLENDAHAWQQDKGQMTAFSSTAAKNYTSQGLGGEIMQVQLGRLIRAIYSKGLQDIIKLVNTVHDSVYIDFDSEASAVHYLPMICALLEDVTPYFNRTYKNISWDTAFPVTAEYGDNLYETTNSIETRNNEWVKGVK